MAHATPTRRARQVRHLHRLYTQAPGLPFADLLPADQVEQALRDEAVAFPRRLFSPLVTLWLSLSQVLDPDHSCRAARRLRPCSANVGAYCKARGRLPEAVLARLTRATGRTTQQDAPAAWRWNG